MKRFAPIMVTLVLMMGLIYVVVTKKNQKMPQATNVFDIGAFTPMQTCAQPPKFLQKLHIPQPVVIDLSQKRYKGVAFLFGKNFTKVLHPKQWEQYEHFSTYALDIRGNAYLIPTPYISIKPTTFNLQKKIFKLNTNTGKIEVFMDIEEVHPTPNNPYGLNAIAYDCDDHTLWGSAIDESGYERQRGVIYHIDPKTKSIVQRVEGFDALTLSILRTKKGKYLLAGSARDNGLYAFDIHHTELDNSAKRILEIPDPNAHIRKIKMKTANQLELQTIPFSYSLIAQSSRQDRIHYTATKDIGQNRWRVLKSKNIQPIP
jgi:hypothetical protein